MTRSILAAIVFALIAVHAAAGEEDLDAQIKALQKERLETLTRLVEFHKKRYEFGYVSGEVYAEAETALVNAELDAALVAVQLPPKPKFPDPIKTIIENTGAWWANALEAAADKDYVCFVETNTDFLLLALPSLHLHLKLARAEKDEADIKKRQAELIEKLTKLVENYQERYKAGTAPLETLVKAQAALLDAQVDAAEKSEERVALLAEHAKSEAELFKVADSKRKASACSARSLVLATKIRMLQEQGEKDDVAAQIKAAQKERVEALTELVKIDKELYETSWGKLAKLTQAKVDLANARADAAETSEAKILVLTEAVKEQIEVVRITELRAGLVDTFADVCRERLHLLDFKIRILKERALEKAKGQ